MQEYSDVEKDFVARAPDDAFFVLETRRRVAEDILSAAHSYDQPFDVCTEAWNHLLRLGFSNIYQQNVMTRYYADSCLMNENPEAGIAVLEPLIADFEGRVKQSNIIGHSLYGEKLEHLYKLRAELIAQRERASQDK